jgi:hypothetical protein
MQEHLSSPAFQLGQIVITRTAQGELNPEDVYRALRRHAGQDWGEVCPEDWAENERALKEGFRLLSVYRDRNQVKFWIITEAGREGYGAESHRDMMGRASDHPPRESGIPWPQRVLGPVVGTDVDDRLVLTGKAQIDQLGVEQVCLNGFPTLFEMRFHKVIEAARGAVSQVTLQVQQQFLAEPAGHGGDAEGMLSLQYLRHPAETD